MSYTKYLDGWISYNDLATQTTPISYTGGVLSLSNDGAGPYSDDNFSPSDIAKLWDTTTNQFDFSGLKIGDEVCIRTDIVVTTIGVGQVVKLNYTFDIGGSPYDITIDNSYFKTAGTYNIVDTEKFYIGFAGMRDNPGEVRFESDANANIVINGFFISVKRR